MAIQTWTISKIVGPTSLRIASNFATWAAQRKTTDPAEWSPSQFPLSSRRKISHLLQLLNRHRHELPTIYHSQHVDGWTGAGQIEALLVSGAHRVMFNHSEVWCYPLPDRGKLLRRSRNRASRDAFPETHWLTLRILEAIAAEENRWKVAVLLIARHTYAASLTDEESHRAGSRIPKWFAPPNDRPTKKRLKNTPPKN